eukprot:6738551-Prymnesium_polylepis.1
MGEGWGRWAGRSLRIWAMAAGDAGRRAACLVERFELETHRAAARRARIEKVAVKLPCASSDASSCKSAPLAISSRA